MFEHKFSSSKESIEYQRSVFKAFVMVDAIRNALIGKGLISKEELIKYQEAAMSTDYVKGKMAEYDKAIKEIEEYEKMDLGDLISSMFKSEKPKDGKEDNH